LARDALLATLHPLLENVLQTVDHVEISCLGAPFSWLEKPRNRMDRARSELNSVFGLEKGNWWNPIRTSAIQFTGISGISGDSSLKAPKEEIKPIQLTTNQKAESGPENGALTGINTGLGCPPYPHKLNDPEDEGRDGLGNVGPYKTEPPPTDSPKELHHKH
jgi:hypothetical protein